VTTPLVSNSENCRDNSEAASKDEHSVDAHLLQETMSNTDKKAESSGPVGEEETNKKRPRELPDDAQQIHSTEEEMGVDSDVFNQSDGNPLKITTHSDSNNKTKKRKLSLTVDVIADCTKEAPMSCLSTVSRVGTVDHVSIILMNLTLFFQDSFSTVSSSTSSSSTTTREPPPGHVHGDTLISDLFKVNNSKTGRQKKTAAVTSQNVSTGSIGAETFKHTPGVVLSGQETDESGATLSSTYSDPQKVVQLPKTLKTLKDHCQMVVRGASTHKEQGVSLDFIVSQFRLKKADSCDTVLRQGVVQRLVDILHNVEVKKVCFLLLLTCRCII
jgi:hypothetical protein